MKRFDTLSSLSGGSRFLGALGARQGEAAKAEQQLDE